MKVLIDMNLSPAWVPLLQELGFGAVHWSSVGRGDAPDKVIMRYAAEQDYVVLTNDLDFGGILAATGGERPSVVQIRARDIRPTVIGARVVTGLRQMQSELQVGALLTIDTDRMRLRLLPLAIR